MKKCKTCDIDKELSDFYLLKNGKAKGCHCKDCYGLVYKYNKDTKKRYNDSNKEIIKKKPKHITRLTKIE